jgi:hypothetical protein
VPAPTKLQVTYAGRTEGARHAAADAPAGGAMLGSASGRVTPVNALHEAAARGLEVSETLGGDGDGFDRLLRIRVEGAQGAREIEATLQPRPARGAPGRRRARLRPGRAPAADAQRGQARRDRQQSARKLGQPASISSTSRWARAATARRWRRSPSTRW